MRAGLGAPSEREVFGIFKGGYQGHAYRQWLLDNVATILDDTLSIGSAGLLRLGAQAWVSVEVPDNVTTPEGVTFRPHLIAATSFDGSLATTYKRSATVVVCDNTLAAGLSGSESRLKVKHTRNSAVRIGEAREALAIVYSMADDMSAEIARLCAIDVPPVVFGRVLDRMVPLTDAQGRPLEGAALTLASRKRDEVSRLYRHDDRAAPWNGTAYGVLAAWNTYGQHYGTVRGMSRIQRNRSNAIDGTVDRSDAAVLAALEVTLAA
jgi:phage/plasmid-like protein (TIGR03299 family)